MKDLKPKIQYQSKNATKFKREVTMPEIENREDNEDEVCYEIAIIPM